MSRSTTTLSERDRRRARLSKAIEHKGLSVRATARTIAQARGLNEMTLITNFKRWMAAAPRPGAIDAAPDWIFEAVDAVSPPTLGDELRAAIRAGHIPLALAKRIALLAYV